jgi:hypothetical protein
MFKTPGPDEAGNVILTSVNDREEDSTCVPLEDNKPLIDSKTEALPDKGTKFLKLTNNVEGVLWGTEEGNMDETVALPTIGASQSKKEINSLVPITSCLDLLVLTTTE